MEQLKDIGGVKEIIEKCRQMAEIAKTSMPTNLSNDSTHQNNICPICDDTGWELARNGRELFMRKCKCGTLEKQIMERRLAFANIPESFKGMTLSNFYVNIYRTETSRKRAETALKAVEYWLNHFENMKYKGMGLYLYSTSTGSGKTRMAVSIANELILNTKIPVKFATSLQILNEIKGSWNEGTEYCENQLLKDLSAVEVLIIDDFGIESGYKDWINERFYHIINTRYIDKKITIFTSNLRIDQLSYNKRITERIIERTFQILFPEESVRELIAKKNLSEFVNGIKNQ